MNYQDIPFGGCFLLVRITDTACISRAFVGPEIVAQTVRNVFAMHDVTNVL